MMTVNWRARVKEEREKALAKYFRVVARQDRRFVNAWFHLWIKIHRGADSGTGIKLPGGDSVPSKCAAPAVHVLSRVPQSIHPR